MNYVTAAIAGAILYACFGPVTAWGHDWYTGLVNEHGQACCGGDDCAPLADGDVRAVPGGYYIISHNVFVPQSRVQPSREEDGLFHACFWGTAPTFGDALGTPKCFFEPPKAY